MLEDVHVEDSVEALIVTQVAKDALSDRGSRWQTPVSNRRSKTGIRFEADPFLDRGATQQAGSAPETRPHIQHPAPHEGAYLISPICFPANRMLEKRKLSRVVGAGRHSLERHTVDTL
jgi:hypothetical protein